MSVRILILIFGLFVVSGCSTISEKTVHGSNYVLDKGVLEITLEENPSTGFSWQYTIDKSGIVKFIEDKYIDKNSNGKLGSPGVHKWSVKGVVAGNVKITFVYSKNNEIDKEMEYILTVDHNGKISNVECREIVLAKGQPDNVSEKKYTWGESALLKEDGVLNKLIDDELETTPYKIEYADDKTFFLETTQLLLNVKMPKCKELHTLAK